MTIEQAVQEVFDLSESKGMTTAKDLKLVLRKFALSQLEEAMGRVDLEDRAYEEPVVETNQRWRAKLAAVLEEYKQCLV